MQPSVPFHFDVVKPDGPVLSETVDECVIPGLHGSFGVLPGHAPLLTLVGTGELMWRRGEERRYLAVSGGFCEVRPDRVTVLAETAERAEDIDLARAERARSRAATHLDGVLKQGTGAEIERVRATLERAELRVRLASQGGTAEAGH